MARVVHPHDNCLCARLGAKHKEHHGDTPVSKSVSWFGVLKPSKAHLLAFSSSPLLSCIPEPYLPLCVAVICLSTPEGSGNEEAELGLVTLQKERV